MEFGKKLKHLWLLDEEVVFLNHASFGATPKSVLKTAEIWHERIERQPLHFFMDEHFGLIREAASKLARFVNTDPAGLVFVENATSGMNTAVKSLMPDLKPGDEILTTNHLYPAVKNLFDFICDLTGAKLIEAPLEMPVESEQQIIDLIANYITEKTKIASFDHITSPTALIFPVRELTALCRKHGIITMIDGAHAPGMLDLDVDAAGSDFYTGNCHKWLFTPKGCAFLKVGEQFREKVHPLAISLFYKCGFTSEFDWVGTRNPSSWLSVGDAINFYECFGGENIRTYIHNLAMEAGKLLSSGLGTEMPAPESMIGSIIAIRLPGKWEATQREAHELRVHFLKEYQIEVPFTNFGSEMYVRPAAQIYNEIHDYELLLDALLDFTKRKGC